MNRMRRTSLPALRVVRDLDPEFVAALRAVARQMDLDPEVLIEHAMRLDDERARGTR